MLLKTDGEPIDGDLIMIQLSKIWGLSCTLQAKLEEEFEKISIEFPVDEGIK